MLTVAERTLCSLGDAWFDEALLHMRVESRRSIAPEKEYHRIDSEIEMDLEYYSDAPYVWRACFVALVEREALNGRYSDDVPSHRQNQKN